MSTVSVVMSTYCRNRPEGKCPNLLRRALDSILAQTFEDWELVLIDDCSKDGTDKVCLEYAGRDSRIRCFRAKKNSGLSAKRYNDGMRLAKSDLFMYMFDDDELCPGGMKALVESIRGKNERCGMVFGTARYWDELTKGERIIGGRWDYGRLKGSAKFCILCNLAVVVRKEVINDVGGYDENPLFRRNCDWDLWVRIGERHGVAAIQDMIGTAYQGYRDSVGQMFRISNKDYADAARIQGEPERRVRLKGEMGLPVDSVLEEYERYSDVN